MNFVVSSIVEVSANKIALRIGSMSNERFLLVTSVMFTVKFTGFSITKSVNIIPLTDPGFPMKLRRGAIHRRSPNIGFIN